MKKLTILVILLVLSELSAETIYLNNGKKLTNVKIISRNSEQFIFLANFFTLDADTFSIAYSKVKTIVLTDLVPFEYSKMIYINSNLPVDNEDIFEEIQAYHGPKISRTNKILKKEYKNLKLWTIPVISLILTYDYLKTSSNISKSIDEISKFNPNSSELNRLRQERDRKFIFGIIFSVCFIYSTYNLFESEKISVKTSPEGLSLTYNF